MIASTMVRASAKGLPLRPVGRGSMSAIIDHWASESTWNLDIWPVSQDGRYIFVRHALALPGPGGPGGSTPAAATHRGRVASVDSFRCHRGTRADGRSDPCSRAGGLAERKCVRFECGSRGESPAGVRSPRPPLPLGWEWGPAAAGEHRLANLAFVDEAPAEGSLASNQET